MSNYQSSKENVMKARNALKAAAEACSTGYESVEDAVDAVVMALEAKSVSYREDAKDPLVKKFKEVVGDE